MPAEQSPALVLVLQGSQPKRRAAVHDAILRMGSDSVLALLWTRPEAQRQAAKAAAAATLQPRAVMSADVVDL